MSPSTGQHTACAAQMHDVVICGAYSDVTGLCRRSDLLSLASAGGVWNFSLTTWPVPQVGDAVWSMLPGERTLAATHTTDVDHVTQAGYVNVHTLQGERCPASACR